MSEKAITYHDEFKRLLVLQLNEGKTPRMVFEQVRFNVEMIGMKRIEAAASCWKLAYKKSGLVGLKNTRQMNSGRRLNKELTAQEQTAKREEVDLVVRDQSSWIQKGVSSN